MGKDLKGKELGKGIRQRKDGRYEARLKVNGVEQQIYSNSLTEIKKEYIKMKKASEESLDYKKQGITLNEWFNEWFDTYKAPHIKSTSIYPMKSKFNNSFGKIIGDKKLVEIRNMDIQNVINQMQSEGRAVSSMRDALGRVRECMESAKNNRIITINPCFDITIPWEKKAIRRRFLSKEEQNLFLKIASDKWYKEMFYIMFLTGLRVGELGGLMWKDIDFEKKCIRIERSLSCQYEKGVKTQRITTPKTYNSYRTIPFMGEAEEMLKSQLVKQKALKKELGDRWRSDIPDLVFTTTMGSPVTRYIAEKECSKIVDEMNLQEAVNSVKENRKPIVYEPIYPHAIRHTFCSRCFEMGMNPKVVQQLMGHQHYSTTVDIYTHVTKNMFDKEIKKLESALFD